MTLKKKNLVVHIGLPKTGTTTLQKGFFPKYSGYVVGAIKENRRRPLAEIYYQFSGSWPPSANGWQNDLKRWVDELLFDESGLLIISKENMSQWSRGGPSEHWPLHYESPLASGTHPITVFLSELRSLLPQEINLTTIVTLRNQSDFLGSLAAELAEERYFKSARFDRLVTRGDVFLDFNQFVRDLENVSGAQNHLTLLFEDGLETQMSKIIDLIGPPDLDTEFDPGGEIASERVRRTGASSWAFQKNPVPIVRKILNSAAWRALRKSKWWPLFRLLRPLFRDLFRQTVEISDADRLRIRAICHKSNELLAAHLKRNLVDLGY